LAVGVGAVDGDTVTFYTSNVTFPSEAFYNQKAEGWLGKQAVVFVSGSSAYNGTVYCSYKGNVRSSAAFSMELRSGSMDIYQSHNQAAARFIIEREFHC
jgi:hypothetical protein